jgi:hypothetical protein
LTAPSTAHATSTTTIATATGTLASAIRANSTVPTASVEAREMSISPCTTTGMRPNATMPKMTKYCAEASNWSGSR